MRKKRGSESDKHRERREDRERVERMSAEDKALDAAVRRSIKLHGP